MHYYAKYAFTVYKNALNQFFWAFLMIDNIFGFSPETYFHSITVAWWLTG